MTQFSRRDVLKAGAAWAISPALFRSTIALGQEEGAYADAVFVDGEPPRPQRGSFTIAVLPDTQNYSQSYPELYVAQTKWLVENRDARNIACVLHLGDITNRNTPEQWENAVNAMNVLDGQIPYFMVPGNHDYSEGGRCTDRTTLLNEYFPVDKFREESTFGGVYDKEPERMENSYHTFNGEGRDFLVVGLEFGPRRDVIRWVNEVVAQHADRPAILITHAYMYYDETRYDWQKYGPEQRWNPHNYGVAEATGDDVADGEELWNQLVRKNKNFVMTLNGHVLNDGLARLTSQDDAGRNVHQVLVNFQMKPNGGDGWLRLIECRPDGTMVRTYDYSPTRNQVNASPQNQFALKLASVGA